MMMMVVVTIMAPKLILIHHQTEEMVYRPDEQTQDLPSPRQATRFH